MLKYSGRKKENTGTVCFITTTDTKMGHFIYFF